MIHLYYKLFVIHCTQNRKSIHIETMFSVSQTILIFLFDRFTCRQHKQQPCLSTRRSTFTLHTTMKKKNNEISTRNKNYIQKHMNAAMHNKEFSSVE